MKKPKYYLNLRERLSIKSRIKEIVFSLTLFTFISQILMDISFLKAIIYGGGLMASIMFLLNPFLNWQDDRAKRKVKVKENN